MNRDYLVIEKESAYDSTSDEYYTDELSVQAFAEANGMMIRRIDGVGRIAGGPQQYPSSWLDRYSFMTQEDMNFFLTVHGEYFEIYNPKTYEH